MVLDDRFSCKKNKIHKKIICFKFLILFLRYYLPFIELFMIAALYALILEELVAVISAPFVNNS